MTSAVPAPGTGAEADAVTDPERLTLGQVWPEAATYAVLAALGAYLTVTSFGYGITAPDSLVGAGTMPLAMGVLMLGLATILCVRLLWKVDLRSRWASRGEVVAAEEDDSAAAPGGRSRARCFLMVLVTLAVTIALTPVLGMQVAFGLMVLWLAAGVERMRLRTSILVAVVAMVVSHLIFRVFLEVALPDGIFGGMF